MRLMQILTGKRTFKFTKYFSQSQLAKTFQDTPLQESIHLDFIPDMIVV